MAKSVEDIIVPERRRSIRDIPIPSGRRRAASSAHTTEPTSTDPLKSAREVFSNTPPKQKKKSSKKGIWVAVGGACILLAVAAIALFDSSILSYTPKSAPLSFNEDVFVAKKSGEGSLIYSVVKLSRDGATDVAATGEQQVSRKASGTIVVYNNFSAEPQKLIATTRFEASNGKVYRVAEDIVVPGRKTVAGANQPGSIEVVVYADAPGADYNTGLSDLTLPALKGTSRFETIYARSKTPMAGGFIGMEKGVSPQVLSQTMGQLETSLKDNLIGEGKAQTPEGFVLIPGLSFVTFEDLPQTPSSSAGSVTLNRRGHFSGVMFKASDLSTHLANKKVSIAPTESVDLLDLDKLAFKFAGTASPNLALVSEINFSVSGPSVAVWKTDEVALQADLAGRNKRELPSILTNFPTIVSATPILRPLWRNDFPDDASKITIKQESPK